MSTKPVDLMKVILINLNEYEVCLVYKLMMLLVKKHIALIQEPEIWRSRSEKPQLKPILRECICNS